MTWIPVHKNFRQPQFVPNLSHISSQNQREKIQNKAPNAWSHYPPDLEWMHIQTTKGFIWLAFLCSVLLIHWQKGDGLNFWPLPSFRDPQTLENSFWTTVSTNAACSCFVFIFPHLTCSFCSVFLHNMMAWSATAMGRKGVEQQGNVLSCP